MAEHRGHVNWGVGRLGVMAFWFAIVGGLTESIVQASRYSWFGVITDRSRYLWWMTPTAYVVIMVIAALLIAGSWAIPRLARSPVLASVVFAFAMVFSLALSVYHERANVVTLGMLAAGAASVVGRTVRKRGVGFERLIRHSLPWLVMSVVLLSVGSAFRLARSDRHSGASVSGATHPNILLLIFDTVRRHNVSLYGYDRETTVELERLASTGVTFQRAFSPSSWTLPAHGSMFTGRMPNDLSADWNVALDGEFPTVAERLTDAGYATAGFVANRDYATYQHGLDRGFQHYEDHAVSVGEILLHSGLTQWIVEHPRLRPIVGSDDIVGLKRAERVVDDFLDWSETVGDRPFFAFVNFFDAHDPYLAPEQWFRRFGVIRENRLSGLRRVAKGTRPTAAVVEDEMAAYDGAIAYMDAQLGRLLRALEVRGVRDETVIIIASDHGEEFGEHSLIYHGHSLYATQLWVPLVISAPGSIPEGVLVQTPVTLRDIAATILEFAGIQPPPQVEGTSLARFWTDSSAAPDDTIVAELRKLPPGGSGLPAALGDMRSTLRWPFHTIHNGDGTRQRYNLLEDPWEWNDLRIFRPPPPRR